MTSAVDQAAPAAKLEQRGLVRREANPSDRRAALVAITDEGAAAVDEIFPRRLTLEGEALASLAPDQRADVVAALQLLSQTVEARARR